ncbi:MAG: nucleotidyltransferase family protein [Sphingomicrobium sp.]
MGPAFVLIVACCRRPVGPSTIAAIRSAAARVDDWNELVRLADRHRVEPLVATGLTQAGVEVPPALGAAADRYRAESLRDVAETLRIAAALDDAGIAHRFLKGAALGVVALGSPIAKRSWDIDLLVLPGDAVTAAACLGALDYRPSVPPRPFNDEEFARWRIVSKEAEFRSPSGSTVELHWRLSDHPHLLPGITADGPKRMVPLLGSHVVATLADDINLAYLAVHGTTHAWFRLKWLADFNGLLHSIEPERRVEILAQARALGVGRSLDAALGLARKLFGDGDGGDPPVGPTARLVTISIGALLDPDPGRAARRGSAARWLYGEGLRFQRTEIAIRLRGTLDRLDFPLPARLGFLYPLLRLPLLLLRRARSMVGTSRG